MPVDGPGGAGAGCWTDGGPGGGGGGGGATGWNGGGIELLTGGL